MKKLSILFFLLTLCLPISSHAYIYFVAVDDLAADGLLAGVTVDPDLTSTGGFYTANLLTSGSYSFVPGGETRDGVAPTGLTFPSAGTINAGFDYNVGEDPGLLFSYTSDVQLGLPGVVGASIDPGTGTVFSSNYFFDAAQTFEFTSYSLNGATVDGPGAVHTISTVPVPSAVLLLAPGLLALFGLRRRMIN